MKIIKNTLINVQFNINRIILSNFIEIKMYVNLGSKCEYIVYDLKTSIK